jgi:hypothetical protein
MIKREKRATKAEIVREGHGRAGGERILIGPADFVLGDGTGPQDSGIRGPCERNWSD